jgi:N-acetylmuramoyl-L-alanine amidase
MAVVVIDPGHGGTQKVGGSSPNNATGPGGTLEKAVALQLGLETRAVLTGRGHDVRMTRDHDLNLGLKARATVAKQANADVFVAIHLNASNQHNAQGTETLVDLVYQPQSGLLCRAVQGKLVAALGLFDRNQSHGGVKKQSLGVLKIQYHAAKTACVLTEVSFLDRADEEERLLTPAYRTRAATAIADGVEAYLGLSAPADAPAHGDAIEAAAAEGGINVATLVAHASPMGGQPTANTGLAVSSVLTGAADVAEFQTTGVDVGMPESGGMPALPAAPVVAEAAPTYEEEFAAFIATLHLQHFSSPEFLVLGSGNAAGHCAGKNHVPDKALWPNIAKTALMLDEIRRRLGASISIHSVYRAPAYNSCVGGKPASLHLSFNAIDWSCSAGTVQEWHQTAVAVRSSNAMFVGGIGFYVAGNFVHVDTRGTAVDWAGPG